MFDLHFEINGRPASEHDFKDAINKAIYNTVKNHITQSVGSIRCPEHHQAAKIVAKGHDLSSLSFNVSGCCQKLIDEVSRKLK